MEDRKDKFLGCLIGGAVGDALGYPIEFLDEKRIFEEYGKKGICDYQLIGHVAQVSDDTQMTLFTAEGLLLSEKENKNPIDSIALAYRDWLYTQQESYPVKNKSTYTQLIHKPELFSLRAPGITCLSALRNEQLGTIDNPINDSKGCGGIMRVAPIGLFYGEKTVEEIDMIGAQAAALTHGHELGYISSAALVHIVYLLSHHHLSLLDAVKDMRETMIELFPNSNHMKELITLIDKAIILSTEKTDDLTAIHQLGEGWVAEETLAIALYCSLKYSHDFKKAICVAVNHGGDSDSTGAVTGNILGAYLGLSAIPQSYLKDLELRDMIVDMAEKLYNHRQ